MRVVIIIAAAVLAHSTAIVGSETLTCSQWQGIRTCSGPNGYVSQTERLGRTNGWDNRGDTWSTSGGATTRRRPARLGRRSGDLSLDAPSPSRLRLTI
jgi:hypothetical protein